MNRDKIIIITTNPFPVGLAGTNRILSYCKGFIYHGYKSEVICTRPTEIPGKIFNISSKGKYQGIDYSYPGGKTVREHSFFNRRVNDFKACVFFVVYLFHLINKRDIAFIIFYGNSILTELFCIITTFFSKIKIFKEESENPHIYFKKRKFIFNSIYKWFYINKLYRIYSGLLVMTHPLREFFISIGIPDQKILVVAQTVDYVRFTNVPPNNPAYQQEYIAYIGSLDQQKDGILSLLEAFSIVVMQFPQIKLIIAGEGSNDEKKYLLETIISLHLIEKVHYLGRISAEEIPSFICNSKLLVSCRPVSIQSDYGFPTKVGEYLASGIPVVTTATGELAYFLEDRVNAFIAKSSDPVIFASKILEALFDYDFALGLAKNGKILAKEKFNPLFQAKKIIDFSK